MSFVVPGDAYDRFVGRYSRLIAPRFVDFARVGAGPVLDLGCGPGALTAELAARHGADRTAAVDPSEPFVAACRARVPGASRSQPCTAPRPVLEDPCPPPAGPLPG